MFHMMELKIVMTRLSKLKIIYSDIVGERNKKGGSFFEMIDVYVPRKARYVQSKTIDEIIFMSLMI